MNESKTPRIGLRRSGAVLAGLAVVVVLSTAVDAVLHAAGVFPPMGKPMTTGLWGLAVAYRFAFTLLGGWTASRLDPERSMRAAWILTGLGIVLGLLGVAVSMSKPELGPAWYAWAVAFSGPPASWLGGKFCNLQDMKKELP